MYSTTINSCINNKEVQQQCNWGQAEQVPRLEISIYIISLVFVSFKDFHL